MVILENAVTGRPFQAQAFLRRVRALGLETPDEAVELVREMRDAG